jgi:hypothetical protein
MTLFTPRNRRIAGRTLILAGVAVWGVYAVVWIAGGEPDGRHYLPVHLSGVIPGALLARWDWLRRKLGRGQSSTPV